MVIAHAYYNNETKAALDDRAARNCAASVGVNVIGTIGLILLAKKEGHVEKPVKYLEKLKNTGFRISDDLYQHAYTWPVYDFIDAERFLPGP